MIIYHNKSSDQLQDFGKPKRKKIGYGYNAYTESYVDMIATGIVDPTKVTRSALENAASIASCVLTTESLVADKPDPAAAGGMGGGMY